MGHPGRDAARAFHGQDNFNRLEIDSGAGNIDNASHKAVYDYDRRSPFPEQSEAHHSAIPVEDQLPTDHPLAVAEYAHSRTISWIQEHLVGRFQYSNPFALDEGLSPMYVNTSRTMTRGSSQSWQPAKAAMLSKHTGFLKSTAWYRLGSTREEGLPSQRPTHIVSPPSEYVMISPAISAPPIAVSSGKKSGFDALWDKFRRKSEPPNAPLKEVYVRDSASDLDSEGDNVDRTTRWVGKQFGIKSHSPLPPPERHSWSDVNTSSSVSNRDTGRKIRGPNDKSAAPVVRFELPKNARVPASDTSVASEFSQSANRFSTDPEDNVRHHSPTVTLIRRNSSRPLPPLPSEGHYHPLTFTTSPSNMRKSGRTSPASTSASSARVVSKVKDILIDRNKYKRLIAMKGPDVIRIFALLQFAFEVDTLEAKTRCSLLVAMQKLAQSTDLFPSHFEMPDSAIQLGGEPVAAGGFADIYRGRMSDEDVSVKMIRLYKTSQVNYLMKKFWKEAILWSQVSHSNLLPMYGLYRFRGRVAVVSPWMEHGNISEYLEQNTAAADRQLLAADVANGLSYLHSLDIVHGDLKGANILVTPAGTACITDFGLSSVSDSKILKWTSQSSRVSSGGTLRWQAPELCYVDGDEVVPNSKASDVYAWACVCYEIFTGNIPFFEYSRDSAVLLRILAGERPSRPPSSSPAWTAYNLTEDIWKLMQKCWEKNPERRPSIQDARSGLHVDEDQMRKRADSVKWNPPSRRRPYNPEERDLEVLDHILT